MEYAESPAFTGHVDTLVRDLHAFASHVDIFDTVFAEVGSLPLLPLGVVLINGEPCPNNSWRERKTFSSCI